MKACSDHNKFWLDKWASNAIGFHEDFIHPLLKQYWSSLNSAPRSNVLVPLCGKSKDLLYLRNQGHNVFGIEISEIAIVAFFDEHKITYEKIRHPNHDIFRGEGLTVYRSDIFDFPKKILPKIDVIYDRASLIALSDKQRQNYSDWLTTSAQSGCKSLLIALEYDEEKLSPPPYLVDRMELTALYRDNWEITHLGQHSALAKGYQARENAYLLNRKEFNA